MRGVIMSKKFLKVLKSVAKKEGVRVSYITSEMQKALDEAWINQTITMRATFLTKPTLEEFFWGTCAKAV